jgi:EPS-associated MarR family transcriptional regulator
VAKIVKTRQITRKILPNNILHEERHLKVLRLLESNPRMNQRDMAEALGVSLGKTNYCLKALLDKGLIKMQNFRNSQNKLAYAYLLTPAGISAKTELTVRYLRLKMTEYENLKHEIELLSLEIEKTEKQVS